MQVSVLALLFAAAPALLGEPAVKSHAPQSRTTKRIDTLLERSPAVARGDLGYKFVDALTGQVLAEGNSRHFFTPASNTKLYTTALGLTRLGPDYKFQTSLRATGPWKPGQAALTDLQLVGGGDPNLSGRTVPYQVDAHDGDPLTALRDLAAQLAAKGVREIDGDVIGVSTRYPDERYPEGWTLDDSLYGYGAPVSALAVNDNIVSLKVAPTTIGQLSQVELQPSIGNFILLNEVVTDLSRESKIEVIRPPGSNELILRGTIGDRAPVWEQDVAVEDPALFAAEAMMDSLEDAGIAVHGAARAEYLDDENNNPCAAANSPIAPPASADQSGIVLASHTSSPLTQVIQVVNKVSQNLHAEMLLREVGYVTRGDGSLACGLAEREKFLGEIGITKEGTGYSLDDGSGLAREDLTTPDSTVSLLRSLWAGPNRYAWIDSLPVGGVDGSLQHRFRGMRNANRIHAKTGSLSNVNALSGYVQTLHGRWIAFSVMVNATPVHSEEIQHFIDRLCALFLNN